MPFGRTELVGLVVRVPDRPPDQKPGQKKITFRKIYRALPLSPVSTQVLKAWRWAYDYALCDPGELLYAVLPGNLAEYGPKVFEETVWRINPLLLSDEDFRKEVIDALSRKKKALLFLSSLLSDETHSLSEYCTISALEEALGISTYTSGELRKAGVIEAVQKEPPVLRDRSKSASSARTVLFKEWGTKDILLSYRPFSRVEDRLPLKKITEIRKTMGGQQLLLFPSMEILKLCEPFLIKAFGSSLHPYHSGMVSAKRREKSWVAAIEGREGIFYGLRSAVWLPFRDLNFVTIIDEEDRGYRQFEPVPRFTAPQVAMVLAREFGAKVLLTSASPSVETALRGIIRKKYAFEDLTGHYPARTDRLKLIDMEEAFRRNEVEARILSRQMMSSLRSTLDRGGKAFLIYQRQGFARYISCGNCHETIKCPVCGTALRYYGRGKNNLVCPVCGHYEPRPDRCPHCGEDALAPVGTGVERLLSSMSRTFRGVPIRILEEEETGDLVPGITVSTSYEPSVTALRAADMVGIIQWDLLELRPDFRAIERSYRFLMKVVSETTEGTEIVVQFFRPYGQGLKAILSRRYKTLLDSEMESRHAVGFSPFSRQIDLIFLSKQAKEAFDGAGRFIRDLTGQYPQIRALGPSPRPSHKFESEPGYRVTILLPLDLPLGEIRSYLRAWRRSLLSETKRDTYVIYFDADPQ